MLVRRAYLELAEGLPRRRACVSSVPCSCVGVCAIGVASGMALLALGLVETVEGELRPGRATALRGSPAVSPRRRSLGARQRAVANSGPRDRARTSGRRRCVCCSEARAVVGETERQGWIAVTVGTLAEVAHLRDDDERARELFEQAREHYLAGGSKAGAAAMDARLQSIAKDRQRPRKVAARSTARYSDNQTEAVMSTTIAPVLGDATVQELREAIHGRVLRPKDEATRRRAGSGTAPSTLGVRRRSSSAAERQT